jgi:hypothetical protein
VGLEIRGEKMRREFIFVFLLLALTGVVYCAPANSTTGGASVYITNYSTIPSMLYAGSTGQLKIALSNAGTGSAQSVSVSTGGTLSAWIGNMGSGSSTISSIPFTIPSDARGVYLLYLTIYYTDSSGSEVNQLTIPLEVSQQNIAEVKMLSVDRQSIFPGDSFSLQLGIKNTGGIMNNVLISSQANSSFFLGGTTYQSFGNVPSGSSINVSVLIQSSPSTPAGGQVVPLTLSYEDALRNTVNETIYIGPVNILSSHAQLKVEITPVATVEIGSEAQFLLTLENRGNSSESAVVEMTPSSVFTPIGSSRIYFDQIAAGGNQTKTVLLGVDPTAAAGYYELSLNITSGGDSSTESVGISVQATPGVTITGDNSAIAPGGSSRLTIKIANTGNSAIRSVTVNASSNDVQVVSSESEFVGTLNVDDYFTYQPTVSVPARLTSGEYIVGIAVDFKDGTNRERVIKKDVKIEVGNGLGAGNIQNRTRNGGFRVFGIDVIPIAEVIVVLIVLYFAAPRVYRKYKEGRKK